MSENHLKRSLAQVSFDVNELGWSKEIKTPYSYSRLSLACLDLHCEDKIWQDMLIMITINHKFYEHKQLTFKVEKVLRKASLSLKVTQSNSLDF